MDIFNRLSTLIDRLPSGPARTGLDAVKLHIGTAIKHLERGESSGDLTAFTDVILRCNHAFEGSVKEAYRVLAEKDPKATTPAFIETFMKDGKILRPKVLAQFENYRKEWRNPSTHDYLLDFDSNEALVAIVSVTVFAIVLCDQIRGKFAFISGSKTGEIVSKHANPNTSALERVREAIVQFTVEAKAGRIEGFNFDTYDVEDALAGFLSGELSQSGAEVEQMAPLLSDDEDEFNLADIAVKWKQETIAIEIRQRTEYDRGRFERTGTMVEAWVKGGSASGGVIFLVDANFDYRAGTSEYGDYSEKVLTVG